MLALDGPVADLDCIPPHEAGALAKEIDAALLQGLGKRVGDAADHLLLAIDQRRPVELRPAHADMMNMGLLDLVQSVAGRDQDFFRRAAAIGAGAAEITVLGQRYSHTGVAGRHRDPEAGIATAEDQHVIAVACHELGLPEILAGFPMRREHYCHSRG